VSRGASKGGLTLENTCPVEGNAKDLKRSSIWANTGVDNNKTHKEMEDGQVNEDGLPMGMLDQTC